MTTAHRSTASPVDFRRPPLLGASGADLLAVLGLIAVCFAVYGQTIGFGFINFDDPGYVFQNPEVMRGLSWTGFRWALTTFTESNWHPLTWLSLMADAQLFGLNAGGYHLTNLLLHAANSALLFAWLRRATGVFWPSLIVAGLFAAHPLHVESVAWISERKDVLSVFFFLLTLLAYTRYAQRGGRGAYGLALLLFATGLAAKPMLVSGPILLLLLDFWPLRRAGVPLRRLLLEKAPFFVLAAGSAVITVAAQHAGNAMVPYALLSVRNRLASAASSLGAYVVATFWPVNLGVYYPYWSQRPAWQPILAIAGLLTVAAMAWRLRRRAPYLAVGCGWFVIALGPVIGVVQVGGQAMADRYTYLPHIGLFIALVWAGADAALRWPRWKPWLGGAATLAAGACVALAMRQTGYWVDGATLFAHTCEVTRPSVNLCLDFANACLGAGRYAEAEGACRTGLHIAPGNAAFLGKMGFAQIRLGKFDAALASFSEADRNRPDDAGTLGNLGSVLHQLGRNVEAAEAFRHCLRVQPDLESAHLGLADALLSLGQPAQAAAEYEAALAIQPGNVPALNRLAWLLAFGVGEELPADRARALALARKAVAVTNGGEPDSLDALAASLAANGDWPRAEAVANAALEAVERANAPAAAVDVRRERAELYRTQQLPRR